MDNTQLLIQMVAKLDQKMERFESIQSAQHDIQASQAKDLENHIKRTDTLQELIEPVVKYHWMLAGATALLSIIATVATIVAVFQA